MHTTLKSKRVSYGVVELVDAYTSPRYRILVNGVIKEQSDNLYTITNIYNSKYY